MNSPQQSQRGSHPGVALDVLELFPNFRLCRIRCTAALWVSVDDPKLVAAGVIKLLRWARRFPAGLHMPTGIARTITAQHLQ